MDIVGIYPNYATAYAAWKAKAQHTVDNALMRYFIVHMHRLLDPGRASARAGRVKTGGRQRMKLFRVSRDRAHFRSATGIAARNFCGWFGRPTG